MTRLKDVMKVHSFRSLLLDSTSRGERVDETCVMTFWFLLFSCEKIPLAPSQARSGGARFEIRRMEKTGRERMEKAFSVNLNN